MGPVLHGVEWKRSDGTKVPGLGFGDMLESQNPGVIVIQEWWGVTPLQSIDTQAWATYGPH